MTTQNKLASNGTFSAREEIKGGLETKEERNFDFEKPEKELDEMRSHLDRFENIALKDKLKKQMEEDKKNFSLNQRASDPPEFMTARNTNQSREFIDRFKGVKLLYNL